MYPSTEHGGKAVKVAELQSDEAAGRVLRRLREATFVFGTPADTIERILDATRGIEGLDHDRFAAELRSPLVEKALPQALEPTPRPTQSAMTLPADPPS